MILPAEQKKMRTVPLCGEKVIQRLESIGIAKLADLRGKDPFDLMKKINLAAGRVIWRAPMAIVALSNLIAAAENEPRPKSKNARPEKI